jgi:hypothetical protein
MTAKRTLRVCGDAAAPSRQAMDKALARAFRWRKMLGEGVYRNAGRSRPANGVSPSYVDGFAADAARLGHHRGMREAAEPQLKALLSFLRPSLLQIP